jgi:protein-S-isoprenylcysteine O-methyltransferase
MSKTQFPSKDERPEHQRNGAPPSQPAAAAAAASIYVNPQYLPGGRRSLPGISIRAYGLGIALGFCTLLAAELAYFDYTIWRAPCFVSVLAVFHYLEFDMTARYNPADAGTASFLLLSNGTAYSVAHSTAMLEIFMRHWLQSDYKPAWLSLPFQMPGLLPTLPSVVPLVLGFGLILLGQVVRSVAMRTAKTNFNHIVQNHKKQDHVLVTDGVYSLSRHPSYFGFFWWGLGTQLMLGNHFCFVAYAVVLWKFFSHRIMRKSSSLSSLVDLV